MEKFRSGELGLQVLLSLSDSNPRYLYSIAQDMEKRLGPDHPRILINDVHRALRRFAESGVVLSVDEEVVNGRVRKPYLLTEAGREVLTQRLFRFPQR